MTDKTQKIREKVERLMYGFNLEADIASCENAEAEKIADIKYQLCKKILEYIDSMQEEPIEDLEEAAEEWDESLYRSDAFKAGANWQKEKMMAKAIDGEILEIEDNDGAMCSHTHLELCIEPDTLEKNGFKDNNKVKVIVIKED